MHDLRSWLHIRTNWLPLLVILAVLGLSAAVPLRASPRLTQLVLVAVLMAFAAWAFLRQPGLGLMVLVAASLVVPFAISTGTQTSINVTLLLLALLLIFWLFDLLASRRTLRLPRSRPFVPLLALVVTSVLAFLAGQLGWFALTPAPMPAQLGGLAVFLLSAAAFFLVAVQVRDIIWLQRLTWLFLGLGALYVAGRLVPVLGGATGRLFQSGATGSLFWIWLVALATGQVLFNHELRWPWRVLLLGLVVAVLYVGISLNLTWNSGWQPPLIAIIAILVAARPRVGLPAALVAITILALNGQRFITDLVVFTGDTYSFNTRTDAWPIVLEIAKASPILGLGPANYYWFTPLHSLRGYYVNFNSHNQYVDLIAQVGLLGLICYLWLFLELAWLAWSLRPQATSGFARGYVYGVIGALAGMLATGVLGDWVLPFVYNVGLAGMRSSILGWMFLGGLVALQQILAQAPGAGKKAGDTRS